MTAILGKLQVGSRVEAALLAYKAGLGPGESEPTRGYPAPVRLFVSRPA